MRTFPAEAHEVVVIRTVGKYSGSLSRTSCEDIMNDLCWKRPYRISHRPRYISAFCTLSHCENLLRHKDYNQSLAWMASKIDAHQKKPATKC
eukprot:c21810_g1_i1 orf=66-341(+)